MTNKVRSALHMPLAVSLLLEAAKGYLAAQDALQAWHPDCGDRHSEREDRVFYARRALEDAIKTAEAV